jgi:hypothetical protein
MIGAAHGEPLNWRLGHSIRITKLRVSEIDLDAGCNTVIPPSFAIADRSRQSLVGGSRVASFRPFRFASKAFNKKIDKETNFHGKVARRRINRVKGQERCLVFMEKASQQAFPKRLFRNERRQQGYATPFYCGVAQHLRVVGAQEPRWLDPVISVGTGELPLIAGEKETVCQ